MVYSFQGHLKNVYGGKRNLEAVTTSDRPKSEFTEGRRFGRRWRQPNLRTLPKVIFGGSKNFGAIVYVYATSKWLNDIL